MPVVTAEQVRDHLSNPTWSDAQYRACEALIVSRQARLQAWLRVPIDPIEVSETVRVMPATGLVVTTYPIYTLLAIDSADVIGGVPADPYELRSEGAWLYDISYDTGPVAMTSRPFSLITGAAAPARVTVGYLAGWGDKADLVGAIRDKVGNIMLNRHDDTIVARNLDAEKPPQLSEEWTDAELLMLRARRRPAGSRL